MSKVGKEMKKINDEGMGAQRPCDAYLFIYFLTILFNFSIHLANALAWKAFDTLATEIHVWHLAHCAIL